MISQVAVTFAATELRKRAGELREAADALEAINLRDAKTFAEIYAETEVEELVRQTVLAEIGGDKEDSSGE